ncbi:MAG: dihydrolipoyl dehydrogenase [Deltaproteobacteria bacterium]|nr:dihydrolipoyl dehydrogenase [Deltaproteobacteria bacterium]MBT4642083.1 dihydrolipoyl dehydrogenase [Deltaproteobacteria bacterium]MBT6499096.1 dihydrolipoyl dehydrogenase [Deltaproteobacteria bacterium]MBT7152987.1 dihydrolipoyl dehydrogenase [Deltaproteobacteria bacterium]MBT7887492.1 dihydrolipoyl dehydrogenase [Deltaproteobacteria bacterium]
MTTRITILGAGPGGYMAAIRAAHLGAEVTVIENDNLGGTCLNWGCIPTKTLKSSAEAMETAGRLAEFGISAEGDFTPDMQAIMARKEKVVNILVKGIGSLFKANQIRLVQGRGTVLSSTRVRVESRDGSITEIEGDKLILATGSKVLNLPDFPLDGETIISSDEAVMQPEIPVELLVIGGGVVGAEFASIFKALGSNVTIVEALDRILPLPSIDEDTSKILQRELKKKKVKLYLNKTVVATQKMADGKIKAILGPSPFLSEVKEKDRIPVEISVDKILVSIGREFNTEGLGLREIGLELSEKGWIPVNDQLKTNIPGIFAIGDVLGPEKIMLAHVASTEALVAAENCLGASKSMDYSVVPSGIFTFPEIGSVGLSEAQAKDQCLNYRADKFDFRGLGKAQAMGELAGHVKIVSNTESGRILGGHIIGPHATDLIAEVALAIKMEATVKDLAETIHLHPSLSEAIMEVAHAAGDECLHLPPVKSR